MNDLKENLEEKVVFLDKIKTKVKKNLGVYLTAAALALGAGYLSGCGDEELSQCCKELGCRRNYSCEDLDHVLNSTTVGSSHCLRDDGGQAMECCICEYSPPKDESRIP